MEKESASDIPINNMEFYLYLWNTGLISDPCSQAIQYKTIWFKGEKNLQSLTVKVYKVMGKFRGNVRNVFLKTKFPRT